jgi:glycosyltransferase involved in cell wall biosynthesis
MSSSVNSGLVSVIMPMYNAGQTVVRAAQSVLNQTYPNVELIIINDCSKDDGVEKVQQHLVSENVRLIDLKENAGVAEARNKGIEAAKGQYIAFLDSDDLWAENKLEIQLSAMQQSGLPCSHTAYERIDPEKGPIGTVPAKERVSYADMLRGNQIGNLTGIYDAGKLGKFYQKKIGHEDYLMWLNVLENAESIGCNQVLAFYTASAASLSGSKFVAVGWAWNILRHELNLPVPKALLCFVRYLMNAISKRV